MSVCEQLDVDAGATLVEEGDFVFGEIAVWSGGRRTATVSATSPMTLVIVLNRDLWRLEREHPDVAAALRSTVSERLGAAAPDPAR